MTAPILHEAGTRAAKNGTHEEPAGYAYDQLTIEHRVAKRKQAILNLEDQRDSLDLECECILVAIEGGEDAMRADGRRLIAERRKEQAKVERQIAVVQGEIAALSDTP